MTPSVYDPDLEKLEQQLRVNPPPVPVLTGDLGADEALVTLREDGTWEDLDYANSKDYRIFPGSVHLRRANLILDSAKKTPPAERERRRGAALKALSAWLKRDPQSAQTWYQSIGVPQWVGRLLLEFSDQVTAEEKSRALVMLRRCVRVDGELIYAGSPATGQNLQWQAALQVVGGCLERDADRVERYVRRIEGELQITEAEGIQSDLSFQQHGRQLYAGGYGLGFTTDAARLAVHTQGTRFALKPDTIELLVSFLLDGQQGMLRGRWWDFTTIGREIARENRDAGLLATAADQLASLGVARALELRALARRVRGEDPVESTPMAFRVFWRSDFVSQTRPSFHFSVRMTSTRMNGSEAGNGENELGAYLGDGATTLMRRGDEYHGIFPLWDWRRIPGVTNAYQPEVPLPVYEWSKDFAAGSDFAGGTGDGQNGLAAMKLGHLGVHAAKAWFFQGDTVLCLGAGIRSNQPNAPLITTLDQCWGRGPFQHKKNWAQHGGTTYLNLGGGTFHAQLVKRTGTWREVDRLQGDPRKITGDVFTAWLEHGIQGTKPAGYAYAILPDSEPENMEVFQRNYIPNIIANSEKIQAVASRDGRITQIVFWEPGRVKLPGGRVIHADEPALVQLTTRGNDGLELVVGNPTQKVRRLEIKLSDTFPGVDIQRGGSGAVFSFEFPEHVSLTGRPQKQVVAKLQPGRRIYPPLAE